MLFTRPRNICPRCAKKRYYECHDWCPACGYRSVGSYVPEPLAPIKKAKAVKAAPKAVESSGEDKFKSLPF